MSTLVICSSARPVRENCSRSSMSTPIWLTEAMIVSR